MPETPSVLSIERAFSQNPTDPVAAESDEFRHQRLAVARRFVDDQQRRVERAESRVLEQMRHSHHWRRRALRMTGWSVLCLAVAGGLLLRIWFLENQSPAVSPTTARSTASPPAISDQEIRLRQQLQQRLWFSAQQARDSDVQDLRAAHLFAAAAAIDPDNAAATNAQLAAELLVGPVQLRALLRQGAAIQGARLDRERRRLLVWDDSGSLRLWDTSSGDALLPPLPHEGILGADFGVGNQLLSWGDNGELRLWQANDGQRLQTISHGSGAIYGAIDTDHGLLSWGEDGSARLWRADDGSQRLALQQIGRMGGATLSRSGERLLAFSWNPFVGREGDIRQWQLPSGIQLGPVITQPGRPNGAIYSPDGERILVWGGDGSLRLWQTATGRSLSSPLQHRDWVNGATFDPTGTRIASWSEDGTLRLWDALTGTSLGPAMGFDAAVYGAQFNSSGSRLLAWGGDATVRLWSSISGQQLGATMRHDQWVNGASFDPSAERVLSWSEDGTLRLWDANSGQPLSTPLLHGGPVVGAAWLNELSVASWSSDGLIRLWTLDPQPTALSPILSEDSPWQPAAGSDGRLQLLDKQGVATPLAIDHQDWMRGARLDESGQRLLVWGGDLYGGVARLWRVADGHALTPPLSHNDRVNGTRFNGTEDQLLSWSDDGTVRLWNASNGAPLLPPMAHGERVMDAYFVPGQRLLSWGPTQVVLWDRHHALAIARWSIAGGIHRVGIDAEQLLVETLDGHYRSWPLSTTNSHDPRLAVELATGSHLNDNDQPVPLGYEQWQARQRQHPATPLDHQAAGLAQGSKATPLTTDGS